MSNDRQPSQGQPLPYELLHPSLKDKVIAVLLWGVGLLWLLPLTTLMIVFYRWRTSQRCEWLTRIYTRTQVALTGNRWRAQVHPDVEARAAYIFVQNHTNHFDHAVFYPATPQFKQGVELAKHFDYPFYGWMMKARGTIPIRPFAKQQLQELRNGVAAEVAAGGSIVVFPEGTRTLDGRLGKFRKGIFLVARDLGVPIVPVTVTGSFEMMRKGSWLIRPGNTITVHCDAPIPTAGLRDDELPALIDKVHGTIAARLDQYWNERLAAAATASQSPIPASPAG